MAKSESKKTYQTLINAEFALAVLNGLQSAPKYLPFKYNYNTQGVALYQRIQQLDEYYIKQCEQEIFHTKMDAILGMRGNDLNAFEVFEFGWPNSENTALLLKALAEKEINVSYTAVHENASVLESHSEYISSALPDVPLKLLNLGYEEAIKQVHTNNQCRKLLFYSGVNMGNLSLQEMLRHYKQLRLKLDKNDVVITGFDLKKDPAQMLAAYNDTENLNCDFNINLLQRINEELGANFNTEAYSYFVNYKPDTGELNLYLISTSDQEVEVESLEKTFKIKRWEPIYMGTSRKFGLLTIEAIANESGFQMIENLSDKNQWFTYSCWVPKLK